jgi:6-pyruvoyltetrahydropterin/6-carboxytetrahydropterin synthase
VIVTVTKQFRFYAAHRNEEIGGKCANIHGHRYGLTVTVAGQRSGSVTVLFEQLERWVQAELMPRRQL